MKHTKNILKSLLITVMALSLLAVSCSKDEGGSKPTSPTPTKLKVVVAAASAAKIAAEQKPAETTLKAVSKTIAIADAATDDLKTKAEAVEPKVTELETAAKETKLYKPFFYLIK